MAVSRVHVTGTLLSPDGLPLAGASLTFSLSATSLATDGAAKPLVVGTSRTVSDANGAVDFYLVPNQGLLPEDSFYIVTITMPDKREVTERWYVASSPSPVDIGAISRVP